MSRSRRNGALRRRSGLARLGHRRLQRRRRQRLPRLHRQRHARRPRARRHRRQPQLSRAPSRSSRIADRRASSACATRSSTPASSSGPSTAPTRRTAATSASTSSTRTCRASPPSARAVVVDGNNADDRGDYRPGRQAAREFGVRSPLDEVEPRRRTRSASCRAAPGCRRGTSRRRRACRRAFRTTPK